MSTTPAPTPPADDQLYAWAEQFLDALLTSADVDVIGAIRWWDRAKAALETAAQSSTTWPQCVAKAAKKLQVDVLGEHASTIVADLGRHLGAPATFAAWRQVAARDAVYITALVRETRTARRTTKKKPDNQNTNTTDDQQGALL